MYDNTYICQKVKNWLKEEEEEKEKKEKKKEEEETEKIFQL